MEREGIKQNRRKVGEFVLKKFKISKDLPNKEAVP